MYLTFMKLILMILKITWSIFKIILLVEDIVVQNKYSIKNRESDISQLDQVQ
jgi:hypothetical protein